MAPTTKHDNSDYSVIEETGMKLGKAPRALRVTDIGDSTLREAERLCARDYLEHHIFFNHMQFHNHNIHHLLASLSLGASQERLQDIYDKNVPMQRPLPDPVAGVVITKDNWHEYIGKEEYYTNFVAFFRREIDAEGGDWKPVLVRYMFDDKVYALVFSGLLHPLIQISYGVEFDSAAILATGLAMACVHKLLFEVELTAETVEKTTDTLTLMEVMDNIRNDKRIQDIPYETSLESDSPISDQVALEYLQQWKVYPTEYCVALKFRVLQSITALIYGATTKPGYKSQYEFTLMHLLTSSYFVPMLLDLLTLEQKIRVLRTYAFVVLRYFTLRHCPRFYHASELATDDVSFAADAEYSDNEQWKAVFEKAVQNDDLHVAKAVRALLRGSILNHNAPEVPANYEQPQKINWLLLAQRTVDTIDMSSFKDSEEQHKAGKRWWSRGKIGFDQYWDQNGEAL
ncbi:hypothetical protein EC988_000718 [Linderina pennispora]|nr:hypothetical protein EC988_000718 [Linderina pennispora]